MKELSRLNVYNVGVGELEGRDAGEVVGLAEAGEVSARRRQSNEQVGGAPAAGPRHRGRPAPHAHHLAARDSRPPRAPRPAARAGHARAARVAAPRPLRPRPLETEHALRATPRLGQSLARPPPRP